LQATQTEVCGIEGGKHSFIPPSVAELTPLFPQLEILELLGRGGMGAVYKAKQKELDRVVALKILPPGIGHDTAFAERFGREAKALAKLNHPGIVTIHDFGRVEGLYYFLMEFVDGVNLHRLLEGGRISPREALAIVPQICDALQYAHDQGIVHRDIKPQNIMLDRRGRVKVADFGLAKLVGQTEVETGAAFGITASALTKAGKVIGTPAYMAPEQHQRPSEVDHRADIYALGVVFYQLLTGELPRSPLAPPSQRVQIDVRLDEVVLKAMEEVPERRYEQASQLKTAVEHIASPSDVGAKSTAVPKIIAKAEPTQPRWWQVFLAGFLTVVLLEFGALALTDRGIGALVLALLAGGIAVAIFLIARKVWLNALLVGMAIAFFSWLAVVAAATMALPLAAVAGVIGVIVYFFAMKRLGASRAFFTGFMIVFLLVFGVSAGITFIMPESFVGTARIHIEPSSAATTGREFSRGYDPYFIQTELEVIQSGAILGKAIENLGLEQKWSRRYGRGQPLSQSDSLAMLKHGLDLRPVRNTTIIEIRYFAESADDAASIANEIARVYQQAGESAAAAAGASLIKISIVDLATPGLRPVRPNKPVNLAIGALAGLLLGTAGGAGLAGYKSRKEQGRA
jgi:capsular polysaccharide biosynthesis protein/predicted Ser/Thr protein kinase